MTIQRETVSSSDGVEIGVATEGTGTPLLLVHGGMCSSTAWTPIWQLLTTRYRVSAIDRRGRGTSSDSASYAIEREYDDLLAVTEHLAAHEPAQIDVMGHSIGATITLGAAARGARYRRITLYEPPGPPTVSRPWIDETASWISSGHVGRALVTFLVDTIGLDPATVTAMRDSPIATEALPITAHTLVREAEALLGIDLDGLAKPVTAPVQLLLGEHSPPWASEVTHQLLQTLPRGTLATLPDAGHDALDTNPDLVVDHLDRFLRID